MRLASTLIASVFLCASTAALAADITGAGATFVYPVLAKWADAYRKETGIAVNYQSIGSGGGIKQIQAKTVAFGASDMPLKSEELDKSGLLQFPIISGAIVPIIHVSGITGSQLKLTGPVLAGIYLGKVKKWNDPAITALNKDLKLPDQAITVVRRSDGSGSTFIWTNYLSKVSPDWKSTVGEGSSVNWPAGVGGKGSEGVASYVKQIDGSIGYVEFAYALENKMTTVRLQNSSGIFVEPESKAFKAAAAGADWAKAKDFHLILTDAPGKDSWPIAGSTFILMHKVQDDPAQGKEALKFFRWAYNKGAAKAEELHYLPLPKKVTDLIEKTWKEKMRSADGAPLATGL